MRILKDRSGLHKYYLVRGWTKESINAALSYAFLINANISEVFGYWHYEDLRYNNKIVVTIVKQWSETKAYFIDKIFFDELLSNKIITLHEKTEKKTT